MFSSIFRYWPCSMKSLSLILTDSAAKRVWEPARPLSTPFNFLESWKHANPASDNKQKMWRTSSGQEQKPVCLGERFFFYFSPDPSNGPSASCDLVVPGTVDISYKQALPLLGAKLRVFKWLLKHQCSAASGWQRLALYPSAASH